MKHKIYITGEKTGFKTLFIAVLIRRSVKAALSAEGIFIPCSISVLLTDGMGIRELNRKFRDTDRETDVLSFPANELSPDFFDGESCEKDMKTGRIVLGDIAINLQRAAEQGKRFGHGTKREISYLTVHSVLHLLGYDHMDEGEEKQHMRSREKLIMASLGKGEEK
ncbi:MAG: rRNA maturation RNase YbeY [Clostridiales bacterium]|nr:rRNA maturation RNase YbeY [Clostridiales bacterium]